MPDHSNVATRETEERLGDFVFDRPEFVNDQESVARAPFELDNGAVYKGQWTKEGLREG